MHFCEVCYAAFVLLYKVYLSSEALAFTVYLKEHKSPSPWDIKGYSLIKGFWNVWVATEGFRV